MPGAESGRPLRVAVTGATGLVGSPLVAALAARGHAVVALSRSRSSAADDRGTGANVRWVAYAPTDAPSVAAALEGVDAVVHLAGHNLFDGRWNAKNKERIRASRVDSTDTLVAAMASMARRPSALVCASAVGIYGPLDPDRTVDETAPPGDDFLATVCVAWEAAARKAEALGVRVATLRFGVVLAREGGALEQMKLPFRLFVGGPVGRGRQVVSWVHRDDVVALLVAAVEDDRWRGPVNVTAPFAVTNREFSKALGRAMHRPSLLPAPPIALRVALGGVASLVTTGQRVLPRVAEANGYRFRYPRIDDALADLI
jgi:uncharacterized protein (TIGR01777 family)